MQRELLKVVWELFAPTATWATFRQVDRKFRRHTDEDVLQIAHELPPGLLEPQIRRPGDRPPGWFNLTLAGVIACTDPTQLDLSLFLGAVRIGAQIEHEWTSEDPDSLPVLTPNDLVVRLADEIAWNQLPENADLLLKRVGWLLNREPVGLSRAVGLGERNWQLSIEREIRHYRHVRDLDSYWTIRRRRTVELALTSTPYGLGSPEGTTTAPPEAIAIKPRQSAAPRQYQVFVSSTYEDLKEARLAVTQALLKTQRCIPAGMELFSASDDPAWDVIERALAYTDYLVLILGNRAGSLVQDQRITFTQKEYQYARDHKIPVLAFLSSTEVLIRPDQQESAEQRDALEAFKKTVRTDKTVETWTKPEELAGKVTAALQKAYNDSPRPGWVRGEDVDSSPPSPPAAEIHTQ